MLTLAIYSDRRLLEKTNEHNMYSHRSNGKLVQTVEQSILPSILYELHKDSGVKLAFVW